MEKPSIGWYKRAEAMKPRRSSSDVRNADGHGGSIHEITMIRGMWAPLDPHTQMLAMLTGIQMPHFTSCELGVCGHWFLNLSGCESRNSENVSFCEYHLLTAVSFFSCCLPSLVSQNQLGIAHGDFFLRLPKTVAR